MPYETLDVVNAANDALVAHAALCQRVRSTQKSFRQSVKNTLSAPPRELLDLPLLSSPSESPESSPPGSPLPELDPLPTRDDLPSGKRARVSQFRNYVPEEETIRNDYSQRYVDGGEWPQNWVLGAEPERRFEEYPKQQRLLGLKKASVAEHALAPMYLPVTSIASLPPLKFDVILLDPPYSQSFTWAHLEALPVPALAADPSFVLLWVGSGAGEGLERGREVLGRWGYRRCEDVVWVKTNTHTNKGAGLDPPTTSLLTRTKQHCLMGIRGTVRRSTDSWFAHCNIDTDVILWEGDRKDPTRKPLEMYSLIENFCLGLRRLELFGRPYCLRPGWVTALSAPLQGSPPVVDGHQSEAFDKDRWEERLRSPLTPGAKLVVPMTPEIDTLRPKSPVRAGGMNAPMNGTSTFNNQVNRMQTPQNVMSMGPGPLQSMMGGFAPPAMGMGMAVMNAGAGGFGFDSGMGMGPPGGMMPGMQGMPAGPGVGGIPGMPGIPFGMPNIQMMQQGGGMMQNPNAMGNMGMPGMMNGGQSWSTMDQQW